MNLLVEFVRVREFRSVQVLFFHNRLQLDVHVVPNVIFRVTSVVKVRLLPFNGSITIASHHYVLHVELM